MISVVESALESCVSTIQSAMTVQQQNGARISKCISNYVKNVTTSLVYPLTINMRGTFSTSKSMYSM